MLVVLRMSAFGLAIGLLTSCGQQETNGFSFGDSYAPHGPGFRIEGREQLSGVEIIQGWPSGYEPKEGRLVKIARSPKAKQQGERVIDCLGTMPYDEPFTANVRLAKVYDDAGREKHPGQYIYIDDYSYNNASLRKKCRLD